MLLIILPILSFIIISFITLDNDALKSIKVQIGILILCLVGIWSIALLFNSNFICNHVIHKYENNEITKEYRIRESDTLYRYVYKRK